MADSAENEAILSSPDHAYLLDSVFSGRGRKIAFPSGGIPAQSAEAAQHKVAINATLGVAKEDNGSPMTLEPFSEYCTLPLGEVVPYSPAGGLDNLRAKWDEMILNKNPSMMTPQGAKPHTQPVVCNGLTHALSVVGFLFAGKHLDILVPSQRWDNYNLIFNETYGSALHEYEQFVVKPDIDEFVYSTHHLSALLEERKGRAVMVVINFPNNPSGYTPSLDEMEILRETLEHAADQGTQIVALCEDPYFGLVFDDECRRTQAAILKESPFASLCDSHSRILAVKIDGAVKEDYAWGLRVGYVTMGVKGMTISLRSALDSKIRGANRATIASPNTVGQSLLLAMYADEKYYASKVQNYVKLKTRYDTVRRVLLENEEAFATSFRALPFNSGYFFAVQPRHNVPCDMVRQVLLKEFSTGVVSMCGLIRIAFSSVPCEVIPTLLNNVHLAICRCRTLLQDPRGTVWTPRPLLANAIAEETATLQSSDTPIATPV